jgi:tRNA A64-2'-O-ribosylphosphate transferase
MPDALSKTVPIWIAVFNRLLFPHDEESHVLRTPAAVVSRSENVQIEQRLPGFVSELQKLHLDLDDLRLRLRGKPMEAAWITPDCDLPVEPPKTAVRNLTVLCTASGRTVSCANKPGSFEYVQGAADDSESWACGLTPILLWLHIDELLSTDEDDLPGLITRLASTSSAQPEIRKPVPIPPTKNLWIASNASAAVWSEEFDIVISCSQKPDIVLVKKDSYIHLPCSTGKNGSRQLRTALSKLTYLDGRLKSSNRVLVTCHTGRDLAVGVALALICLFCDAEGNLLSSRDTAVLSKAVIKHRLSWILLSDPTASPSRATLQSINAFLLG